MKNLHLVAAVIGALLAVPALAQTRLNSVSGPGPTFAYPGMTFSQGGATYYRGVTPYNYSPYGNPYAQGYGYPGYPYSYGVPTALSNGLFSIGLGNMRVNMWRAPSGYYYPWYGVPTGVSQTTVLYAPNASSAPTPQQPPITTVVSDMTKFLDEAHSKSQVSDADYEHLRRRVVDLQSHYRDLYAQSNGNVEQQDEQQIRTDLNSVSMEIIERVHGN